MLAAGIARTAYMFRLANSTNGDATCKFARSGTGFVVLDVCLSRISRADTTRLGKQAPPLEII